MEPLPSQLTTWAAWTRQHEDSLLLDRSSGGRRGAFGDSYASYYLSGQAGVLGERNKDRRLPAKNKVVGLDHGQERIAYAFSHLDAQPVVNDAYDDNPIVVAFDRSSEGTGVFSSTVGGQVLTFASVDDTSMRDEQTGSVWSVPAGLALSGPLAGEQLEQRLRFVSSWFAWTDFYPDTHLYEPLA